MGKPSRWFWGGYKRIGRHLYRHRIFKRWTSRGWKTVRAYWHLWRKNHYNHRHHGRLRWIWGPYRRIGRHMYRQRILKRWTGAKWVVVRRYWHLYRRNHYKRPRWFWGRPRRVGRHQYRMRI